MPPSSSSPPPPRRQAPAVPALIAAAAAATTLLAAATIPGAAAAAAETAAGKGDGDGRVFLLNGLLGLAFASFLSYRGRRKGSLSRSGAMAVRGASASNVMVQMGPGVCDSVGGIDRGFS